MSVKIDNVIKIISDEDLLNIVTQFHSEINHIILNKEYGFFMNKKNAKWYYNNSRIGFFYDLFFCMKHYDISFNNKRIIDLACGGGYLLRVIEENSTPKEVLGIDYHSDAVEFANLILRNSQVICGNLLDCKNEKYDIVIATEVLEHMKDPDAIINHFWNLTASNGVLIVTVPDGRIDCLEAKSFNENTESYIGHINFWSPESFYYYIHEIFNKKINDKSNIGTIYINYIPDRFNVNNKISAIIFKK